MSNGGIVGYDRIAERKYPPVYSEPNIYYPYD